MFQSLTKTFAAIPCVMLLAAPAAHATIETYSFTGQITAGDTTGPLEPFLDANLPVSGHLTFDAGTSPISPGNWDLPTAQLTVDFNGLVLNATGATAHVTPNQDALQFQIDIPSAEFLPTIVTSATIGFGFQTFIDGYFSLSSLPLGVPPNDKGLGISYVSGGLTYGASTDTNIVVTSALVPEPAAITLFGVGVTALALRGRRR